MCKLHHVSVKLIVQTLTIQWRNSKHERIHQLVQNELWQCLKTYAKLCYKRNAPSHLHSNVTKDCRQITTLLNRLECIILCILRKLVVQTESNSIPLSIMTTYRRWTRLRMAIYSVFEASQRMCLQTYAQWKLRHMYNRRFEILRALGSLEPCKFHHSGNHDSRRHSE